MIQIILAAVFIAAVAFGSWLGKQHFGDPQDPAKQDALHLLKRCEGQVYYANTVDANGANLLIACVKPTKEEPNV